MKSLFASLFSAQPKTSKHAAPAQPKQLTRSELARVAGGGPNGTWMTQSSQISGPNGTW